MRSKRFLTAGVSLLALLLATTAWGAYHHGGDTDSDVFRLVYPGTAGTKLDSCAACHTGGKYQKGEKWVTLGSCQWCHYSYGYDESGDIDSTLNPYGRAYRDNGRNEDALREIETLDSDGDAYSNGDEIAAVRFPGNADDDPSKVPAPYRVYSRDELQALPQHTQFMLMNTHKSGDFYAEYSGVTMADLLDDAGIRPEAEGIRVFAPDGWAQYHPLEPDEDPLFYHVYGTYPRATYYYDDEAAFGNEDEGIPSWCDYSAPSCDGRAHGEDIEVENGLQMLLAITRDGNYLTDGELTVENKLDGEGPFRVVPPQKAPGPPDQSLYYEILECKWPFDDAADHNAGFATRSATIIKVDPLPEGTTDIDTAEAGWDYVDRKKIVVYGAIDPLPTIEEKLGVLRDSLKSLERKDFDRRMHQSIMLWKTLMIKKLVAWGKYKPAYRLLEKDLMKRVDGCVRCGQADRNDWITDCQAQKQVYWSLNEITVLMDMIP